ncbi:MAG: IS6 family transposase [Candidatus Aenigmatarchaeota archaeon]
MSSLENAKLLADKQICWLEKDTYLVPSQTYEKKYVVKNEGFRWVCTCPDNQYRRHHCKHIEAVKIWLNQTQAIEPKVKELAINQKCPFCQSDKFIKYGQRKTQFKQKQRYLCKSCGGRFVEGIIKGIRGDEKTVLMAMHLYYSGYSLRKIQDLFSQFLDLKVTYVTLYRWVQKYQKLMLDQVKKIHPDLSNTWHADEQEIKVKGTYVYCWNVIDKNTRFLIASNVTRGRYMEDARKVFKKTKKVAQGKPQFIITDGLPSYNKAIKKEFRSYRVPRLTHLPMAGVAKKHNNNLIERYHNTFRERDKVRRGFRGLRNAQNFVNGFGMYYNYVRPNMALGGLTPAQAAGIDVGYSKNRWMELLTLDGNSFKTKRKIGRVVGYKIKIWDKDGKELSRFKKNRFKTEFATIDKAKEFLQFYEKAYPSFIFFAEKKYG